MDIATGLACAGFMCAFFFGCLMARGGASALSAAVQSMRLRLAAGSDAGVVRRALRVGVPQMRVPAGLLMRLRLVRAYMKNLSWVVNQRGFVTNESHLAECLIVSSCALAFVAGVLGGSVIVGLLVCGCMLAVVGMRARSKRDEVSEHMREAVPDALHAMSACFRSGLSLLQTFQHLAKEVNGPLQEAFAKAAGAMEAGETPDKALQLLRREADVPEIIFVSVALEVQHRSGGSMQSVLDAARDSVSIELRLMRQLRVQTAQARLSAQVVTVMPFLLVGLISLFSPGFLAPFFGSLAGMALLSLALLMQVAGIVLARRMLQVK